MPCDVVANALVKNRKFRTALRGLEAPGHEAGDLRRRSAKKLLVIPIRSDTSMRK